MARKEKRYHYLYKTTNILSGRYYYGMHSTDNLDDGYIGSGKRLRYSINKYGKENHQVEILEFCSDRNSLKEREKEVVTLNEVAKVDCMNLVVGGNGGLDGLPKETIQKIRQGASDFLYKLWKDPEFIEGHKKRASDRMKKRHLNGTVKYDTFTNKKHSEETKKLMSNARKGTGCGEKNSQFGTCWIRKNGISKKINCEELLDYQKLDWVRGRY